MTAGHAEQASISRGQQEQLTI